MKWENIPANDYGYRVSASIERTIEEPDTTFNVIHPLYMDHEFITLVPKGVTSKFAQVFYHSNSEGHGKLHLSLLVVDDHYYNYHQSLLTNSVDNPFAEPAPIYSNFEGGLGVFAAYNTFTIVKEF